MARKIGAHAVFIDRHTILKNGVVHVDDQGYITDIQHFPSGIQEQAGLEFYNGMLVPGFVNAHCHLELSHLRGKLQPGAGMSAFIEAAVSSRGQLPPDAYQEQVSAIDEMRRSGIVAVGDVCNTPASFTAKKQSPLYWHNFAEIMGQNPASARASFEQGLNLLRSAGGMAASLSAHSQYSASSTLIGLIAEHCDLNQGIFSIHNQESASEREYVTAKNGPFAALFSKLGFPTDTFSPYPAQDALQGLLPYLPEQAKVMLVHNVHSSARDVSAAVDAIGSRLFWCLCPQSNLFIEERLPDAEMLARSGACICLGTDSPASCQRLSILQEMKVLSEHFPALPLPQILEWATINGAHALNIAGQYGSIAKGKRPGLSVIAGLDLQNCRLSPTSIIKPLL